MATNTDEREEIKPVAPTEQTKWRDPSLVGKYMVDPKTGLAGLFRSPDNGETWVLTDTVYGHVYNQDEVDNIWDNGAGHKVADEVKSATADLPNVRKQADEAVKFAESAIAASKVNSDAIVAQSEAISEAKSAMDSATAEIQQTAANAASDAAKIRADVARVQNEVDTAKSANSASVEALKSDINTAKQDLADVHDSLDKAQSAIEQNQKAINDSIAEINANVDATNQDLAGVRKDLTKAQSDITANQKAVNDNVAQINSNIEQDRKDIASAQQANADTAKQLDTYSKQATEQGKTIKTIQDKQDGFTATLADVQGNVSQVSDKVDGLSASLKDTQGNVASVKAQADQLSTTLTNHGKSIATLTASAKELSSTLEDADGRLSKVEQTVQTNSSTLSDVQGDLSQVKQNATKLVSTLKDAQGNISTLQQKADSVSTQLATAQGDIATLQTGVDSVKAILTSHDKSIHTLQADSKSLKDSMVNAQGDISTLRKTATDVTSELEDHTGRLSKVEQSAAKQAITLSDLQGNLSQVEQKADSNTTTISSINKNAMQDRGVITDTKTSFDSLTQLGTYSIKACGLSMMPEQHYGTLVVSGSAGSGWLSQQFVADTTGNVYTRVFSNNAWSAWKQGGSQDAINQVKQTADSNSATIRNVQGDVNTLKQTATGVEVALADHEGDIHTLQADSKTLKDDMADAKGNISSLQKTSTSLVSEFRDHDGRLSKVEQTATEHTSELADTKGNLDKVTQKADNLQLLLSDAQKNIQNIQLDAKGLHDTLTGQNNQLASLNVTINNLDSKYSGITGDLQSKQTALSTEQQQTKDMLLNKADKSEVDNVKGTVNQVSAEQKIMAGQISQKVSSAEYQTLRDKVNGIQVGTSNLLHDTSDQWRTLTNDGGWLQKTTASSCWTSTSDYHGGNEFTYAAKITNNSHQQAELEVWLFDQNMNWINGQSFHAPIPKGANAYDVNVTFPITTGTWYIRSWIIFTGGHAPHGDQIHVKDERLVRGNLAGTWEANPTDTITSIQKNTTAIDENSKAIKLKADQTEVDNVKNTASYNSSRLDVMNNEIKSKVSSTDVNNIVDSKGYATTSTVQSLITQKAGTINESITNLTNEMNTRNGVNLLKGTKDFSGSWHNYGSTNYWHTENSIDPNGNHSVKSDSLSWYGYYQPIYLDTGDYTFSGYYYSEGGKPVYCYIRPNSGDNLVEVSYNSNLDSTPNGWRWFVVHFKVTKAGNAAVRLESGQNQVLHIASYKLERGTVTKPVWTPAPSDNATVTQVQQITASIDGLQSRVTNYQNDTSSKYTQLSNLMQSKVGTADFEQLKRSVDMQTLDSADINNMKTNGHYFVHNLTNSPIAGWVYVDVTGNGNNRIRQDVYQDTGIQHKYRRWFDTHWTGWEEGATYTEITQLQDAVNLRVQKGELLSQINLTAGNTLIQSNKLYLDASSVVITGTAFIPSAAIASLSADKINTGTLNTDKISLSNGHVRLSSDDDHFYVQTEENAVNNPTTRFNFDGIDFMDSSYGKEVPQYSIGYDTSSADRHLYINAFDHFNSGGATATQNWFTMVPAISLNNQEINFATKGNMHMQVVDGGVNIKPTLFFQNNTNNGTWAGFTRGDNSDIVEFSTGDNNGENFRIDCGARFMQYVYINGNARAQQWLTNSTLSKKTNIRKLDQQIALDKIRQDDQYLYEYKRNIEQGIYDPQASFIIDDVNDVSHYSVPREFIDQSGNYREPNVELAYLIAAFQAIDKQVQKQKEEIKELKEKLQHE